MPKCLACVDSLEARRLLAATVSFIEVPISSAAVAADPVLADYRTFDLKANFTGGDRFNVAGFDANLSAGDFYRLPANATAPTPAIWTSFPQQEFGTFVCVQNFQPAASTLTYEDNDPILTATRFHPAWSSLNSSTAQPSNYTIARLTIRNNALGAVQGELRTSEASGTPVFFVASLPTTPATVGIVRGVARTTGFVPLANIRVYADLDNDASFDTDEPSTLSENTGEYRLIVPTGSVTLRAVPNTTFTSTVSPAGGTHNLTVAGNQVQTDLNFVFARPGFGSVSGVLIQDDSLTTGINAPLIGATVYVDLDGDATLDSGEPSRITGADGRYSITSVPVGSYRVRRIVPANLSLKSNANDGPITFVDGQNVGGIDFVYFRNDIAAIRGSVVGTGLPIGSGPIANWRVYLDANNDSTFNTGEATALTDTNGNFSFLVAPGVHRLRQVVQSGYEATSPTPNLFNLTLAGGAASSGNQFVNRLIPLPGTISGFARQPAAHVAPGAPTALKDWTVYLDLNNNGTLDPADPRTPTNADGFYQFTAQQPGTYTMRVLIQSGFRRTSTSVDKYIFTLGSGQQLQNRNFELTQRIMFAGVVFDDKNADGIKNGAEKGFGGRRIWVDLNNDAMITPGEPFVWPGSTGTFSFEDLVAGTYTVRAEPLSNWVNVGTGAITTAMASGAVRINMQFGQRKILAPPPTLPAAAEVQSVQSLLEPQLNA